MSQPLKNEDEQIAADGTIWTHGVRAPIDAPRVVDDNEDPSAVLVVPDDIVGVRGIERLDPPFDEEWVVLTLAVRRDIGAAKKLRIQMGGTERTLAVEAPADHLLAPPAEAAPVAATVETVRLTITDSAKASGDSLSIGASPVPPAQKASETPST